VPQVDWALALVLRKKSKQKSSLTVSSPALLGKLSYFSNLSKNSKLTSFKQLSFFNEKFEKHLSSASVSKREQLV